MIPNYFNSSKTRTSPDTNKSPERQSDDPSFNANVDNDTSVMDTDRQAPIDKDDFLMREQTSTFPVSPKTHEHLLQHTTDTNMSKAEQPMATDALTTSPGMIEALLQSYGAAPDDADDRLLQASDLVTTTHRSTPEDSMMGGMGDPSVTDTSGSANQLDSGNDQGEFGVNLSVPGLHTGEVAATANFVNAETTSSQSNPTGIIIDGVLVKVPERSMQAPRIVSADDRAVLNDYQRGRLAKYRPSNDDWPVKNRSASVPPRCVDHYTFIANWPPQEPPRCDLGRRVDVFPPRDAPLHLHLQAYALRWGFWTSEIRDPAVRRQTLDVVADKMKEAWENAIGENYYVRPVQPVDDSDHRNDAEEKVKRGRKRAVSPSKQPAGFVSEGKDVLAVTNAELAENGLTMEKINARVQEKDFEAGEEILDEVLENLGRDQLTVKDWSKHGIRGSVHERNLLMYSLFVVLECRNERQKLNNLLARFSKESQKRNTRARIEMHQEREFQHMALASELEIARREALTESHVDEEDRDDDEMETDAPKVVTDADDEGKKQDEEATEQLATEEELAPNDRDLILQVAQAVLSADSDTALYTAFSERGIDSSALGENKGLDTGDDPSLQAAKLVLGETLGVVTRLISLKEMVKREDNPREAMKMQYDVKLSYQRISQAQQKLAKALSLDFTPARGKITTPALPEDARHTQVDIVSSNTDGPEETTTEPQGSSDDESVSDDHSKAAHVVDSSVKPSTPAPNTAINLNPSSRQAIQPMSTAFEPSAFVSPNVMPAQSRVPQAQEVAHNPSLVQHTQTVQQEQTINPQAISTSPTDEMALKAAYIHEMWRPWVNAEYQKRGQPPYQGVISDWPQLRDLIAQFGFTAGDRNHLLRNYKTQFEQWLKKRQVAQNAGAVTQSPALSKASLSSAVSKTSPSGMPPGFPSNAEIVASIPPTGIHAHQLIQKFQHQVGQHVNLLSQVIHQVAFIDPDYIVYPNAQIAAIARQQAASQQAPVSRSPRPATIASLKPQHIVKLKLPRSKTLTLPPPQDETEYPQDFKSTEVNSTRGFSFRHLPHSTLDQRRTIDDIIAEYITNTSKKRKKTYYGQYISFKDPQDLNGPPIAHGFWDFKNGEKAEGSEWFFDGEDVPVGWLPRLIGFDENDGEKGGDEQSSQYRDVWDASQGRHVKFRLAGPQQQQSQSQSRPSSHSGYNTYPPNYAHNSLDGSLDDNPQDQNSTTQPAGNSRGKKRGMKRGSAAVGGQGGRARGGGASKRRKKNSLADDEDDGDYVPGGE